MSASNVSATLLAVRGPLVTTGGRRPARVAPGSVTGAGVALGLADGLTGTAGGWAVAGLVQPATTRASAMATATLGVRTPDRMSDVRSSQDPVWTARKARFASLR